MHDHNMNRGEPLPEYAVGRLPAEAPLGVPFVPFQSENPPQYTPEEGLSRGTIFPGLDLPFQNSVNRTNPARGTLLGEVLALSLALTDLHLYLDTHPQDMEVTKIFRHYQTQLEDAKKRYIAEAGPLTLNDAVQNGQYVWTEDPWPWDYPERMV